MASPERKLGRRRQAALNLQAEMDRRDERIRELEAEVSRLTANRGATEALDEVEAVLLKIDADLTAKGHPKTSPDRERVRDGLAIVHRTRGGARA